MSESLKEVDEKRGRQILLRLRDMLAQDVQPSVRALGLSEAEARWMGSAGLISITEASPWTSRTNASTIPFEDRYIVIAIPDAAKIYLIDSGISPTPLHQVHIVPPHESKPVKTVRWLGKTLWGLILAGLLVAVGFFVERYLKKNYPDASTSANLLLPITNQITATTFHTQSANSQPAPFAGSNAIPNSAK